MSASFSNSDPSGVRPIQVPQVLSGTNHLQLGVLGNAKHGQALLFAIFDNLGKGAALQNLDLMLSQ